MKRVILLAMIFLPMVSMAAIPELSSMVKRYENVSGATTMKINKEMLSMFGSEDEFAQCVDEIVILATENGQLAATIKTEAMEIIQRINLPLMMTICDDDADVNIYMRQSGGVMTDLVILEADDSEGAMVIISGTLDPNMIDSFMQFAM